MSSSAPATQNAALLRSLLDTLDADTRVAVSCGLGQPDGWTRSEPVAGWRRQPQAMPERGARVSTLDEFAAQQPHDYYSESELIELYQEQHGVADSRSTARRRERLRERLVEAVQGLEQVGARFPQPEDPLQAWLDERVARRLAVAGMRRLADLMFWVRTKGYHWHRGIPRVGPEGAARIVRWLREHEAIASRAFKQTFIKT